MWKAFFLIVYFDFFLGYVFLFVGIIAIKCGSALNRDNTNILKTLLGRREGTFRHHGFNNAIHESRDMSHAQFARLQRRMSGAAGRVTGSSWHRRDAVAPDEVSMNRRASDVTITC